MMNDATRNQTRAADPDFSTWLSANAGSGKTRVLTDRVARMLLRRVPPQNILCLTYTKAAAGEMQNRLFKRLGAWAMLDDEALRDELAQLGETGVDDLSLARTLFAQAIETPGGLKIQTIHSFCAALLRQFPLEAGVSPQFRELDDPGRQDLISDVLDSLAADPALAEVSAIYSGETLADLAEDVASHRSRFDPSLTPQDIRAAFDVDPTETEETLVRKALAPGDLGFLKSLPPLVITSSGSTDQKLAAALAALPDTADLSLLAQLESLFLTGEKAAAPFSPKATPPTKALKDGVLAAHMPRLDSIREAVAETRPDRLAFEAAQAAQALHAFAQVFLPAYEAAKLARGVLDFDDLIDRARRLLSDRSLAWVLYRLDGGIDHILVDEAQDTSPEQWQVIGKLAEELTAGQGSDRQIDRSLFVVGDKKQSIYSFQGADAREFDATFSRFKAQMAAGQGLFLRELPHSFRSSAAILTAVDHTFVEEAAAGLGQDFQHIAFHDTRAGRVDVWPLIEQPAKLDDPEWYDPVDRKVANDPAVVLADQIASEISRMIETETIPGKKGEFRRVRAGDFLILVQRRSDLFDQIIRACKQAGLPMAGADRLKVAAELAVRDILALLNFLALPEDDLSLAAALRSPLFGWSEADLYDLAQGRLPEDPKTSPPYLWETLRDKAAKYPETVSVLTDLRDQADYLRPFELIDRILTRHGGRQKLLSRLGQEAEDGLDELLNQALAFEQTEVPDLTTFLARASAQSLDIKRQTDSSGDMIRVMTVHGSKGLEAPIVILPDTTRPERLKTGDVIISEDGLPVWPAARAQSPERTRAALEAKAQADHEERQRLLYVAMTRAESWLIACGIAPAKAQNTPHWHDLISAGLDRAGGVPVSTDLGDIRRLQHGAWSDSAIDAADTARPALTDVPVWARQKASPPTGPQKPLSPSDLGGAKVLTPTAPTPPDAEARTRGTLLHRLLEVLPDLDPADRPGAALHLGADEPLAQEAVATIAAHPEIFGAEALSEVDLSAHLPETGLHLRGTIDRLLVTDTRITIVDFKSNADVPVTADQTPEGILRQMGAYLAAARAIWPDRAVTLHVLWTSAPTLMEIPHEIARSAFIRATTS